MVRILLTTQPVDPAGIGVSGRAFAVVAPGYPAPAGVPVVELAALLNRPAAYFEQPGTMIVVGMSRMMKPSNRVQLGQVLLRPRPGIRRISVDEVLFVSEPWRMWWHFYAVGAEAWGFTDSFLAETRWRAAHEMQTADPFGETAVLEAIRGVVRGAEPFRFPPLDVRTIAVGADVREAYAAEKEEAFSHEKTPNAIIRRLVRFAQQAVPERSVPTPARLFRRWAPAPRIVRTDLAVDRYLVGRLLEYARLTNAIADAAEVS